MTTKEWMDALTTILGFLVSGLVAFLGTFLTYKSSIKKLNLEKEQMKHEEETAMEKRLKESQEASLARVDSRIGELEKKVDTKIDNLDTRMDGLTLQLEKAEYAYQNLETKVDLRMDIIEKKQDKYNNVIARQFKSEAAINAMDDDIKELKEQVRSRTRRAARKEPSRSKISLKEDSQTGFMWPISDLPGDSQSQPSS